MSPPASVTTAYPSTKLGRRLVRDHRMSMCRGMKCAARGPAGEIEDAKGVLVEVLLRPLIYREKNVIHRSEEPCAGAIGLELIG